MEPNIDYKLLRQQAEILSDIVGRSSDITVSESDEMEALVAGVLEIADFNIKPEIVCESHELTLRAAEGEDFVSGIPRWDEDRYLLQFDGTAPALEDEWFRCQTVGGVVVDIRRADCGAGCRCAGEFRVVR